MGNMISQILCQRIAQDIRNNASMLAMYQRRIACSTFEELLDELSFEHAFDSLQNGINRNSVITKLY